MMQKIHADFNFVAWQGMAHHWAGVFSQNKRGLAIAYHAGPVQIIIYLYTKKNIMN